jgi:hypothetical protein
MPTPLNPMFAKRNVSWRRRTSMSISTPISAMKKQATAGVKARRLRLLPPVARSSRVRSQPFCNPMNADVSNRATIYIRTPRQSRMRRPGEGLYATTGGSISQCLILGRGCGNATGRAKYFAARIQHAASRDRAFAKAAHQFRVLTPDAAICSQGSCSWRFGFWRALGVLDLEGPDHVALQFDGFTWSVSVRTLNRTLMRTFFMHF